MIGATGNGVVRYRMLEPIRQYARERLEQGEDSDEVKGGHTAFFLQLAEEGEPELAGPRQRLWVERLEGEHENLREALSWALESEESELALRLGAALWRFWFSRGYVSEGIGWLEQVLAGGNPVPAPARVEVLEGMGWLKQGQGDMGRAEATYEEMLEHSRALGDKGNVATALNSLGTLALQQGNHERATLLLEENMTVLQQLEEEENKAATLKKFHVLALQGYLALLKGDLVRATALWEEGLALAREAGDTFRIGMILYNLGYAALMQGNHGRAKARCEEALKLARDLGSAGVELIPETLVNLGLAAREQGEHWQAAPSLKEALAVSRAVGKKPSAINSLEGMAGLAGAMEDDIRAGRLWGLPRRRVMSPASLCHPAIGRYMGPTWTPPVPDWGKKGGEKRSSRGERCRSKRPPSTLCSRRPIDPRLPFRKMSRRPGNRQASLPVASRRW